MGRASKLTEQVIRSPLTAEEITTRRQVEQAAGEVEATFDGRLVKRPAPNTTPRPVQQAPASTWD